MFQSYPDDEQTVGGIRYRLMEDRWVPVGSNRDLAGPAAGMFDPEGPAGYLGGSPLAVPAQKEPSSAFQQAIRAALASIGAEPGGVGPSVRSLGSSGPDPLTGLPGSGVPGGADKAGAAFDLPSAAPFGLTGAGSGSDSRIMQFLKQASFGPIAGGAASWGGPATPLGAKLDTERLQSQAQQLAYAVKSDGSSRTNVRQGLGRPAGAAPSQARRTERQRPSTRVSSKPRGQRESMPEPSGPGVGYLPATAIPRQVADDRAFQAGVTRLAKKYNMSEDDFYRVMYFETDGSFDPAKRNYGGSSGTGLIQFLTGRKSWAAANGYTSESLSKMTRVEQLKVVDEFLHDHGLGKVAAPNIDDIYLTVYKPAARGKPKDFIHAERGEKEYESNSGLDVDGDGKIRGDEISFKVRSTDVAGLGTYKAPRMRTHSRGSDMVKDGARMIAEQTAIRAHDAIRRSGRRPAASKRKSSR